MRAIYGNLPFILGLILAPVLICACSAKQEAATRPEDMTISVDFSEVHLCSRISPEITVTYAPKGTKFYDVRLVEEGQQERFLGGGAWPEDGSGLIPEGALTRHYTGPCPPRGREVQYSYVVSAMDRENGQPLAVRLFRFSPNQ